MKEGPFSEEYNKDLEGVVRRELTTYRYRDNMIVKETVIRTYKNDGDYHDTTLSTPMPKIQKC